MQIALILTGGTICSRAMQDGARRSDVDTAQTLLEQHYRREHPYSSVTFSVEMPLNKLSEDLTPDDWCSLLRTIAQVSPEEHAGIIIAHGTDTLEQTAAMLSAALCGLTIPVLLVSAIAPLDDPTTNGYANFSAAVKLICKHLMPGVWVIYENSDGELYLHRGFSLLPCEHGSMSFFSQEMQPLSAVLEQEPVAYTKKTCMDMQALYEQATNAPEVCLLRPYNGLRYDRLELRGLDAVVHGTFHSETANASLYSPYGMQSLLLRCQEAEIPCFLAPCHMTAQSYGSGSDLVKAGAIPLQDMTLSFAYGAVWVSCMQGYRGEALVSRVRQLRQSLESQRFLCCI